MLAECASVPQVRKLLNTLNFAFVLRSIKRNSMQWPYEGDWYSAEKEQSLPIPRFSCSPASQRPDSYQGNFFIAAFVPT